MTTNGVVGRVALALGLTAAIVATRLDSSVVSAEQPLQLHRLDEALGRTYVEPVADFGSDFVALGDLSDDHATPNGDYAIYEPVCCCCCRAPFWFVGAEASFLSIDASTGGQINLSINDSNTPGPDLAVLDGNGVQDAFGYTPRFWFGRQINERWGVVARYWYLSQYTAQLPNPVPGSGSLPFMTIMDTSRTSMYTFDVEGIRSFSPGNWKMDVSVGARHAAIETQALLTAFGVPAVGTFAQLNLSNGYQFNGTGVTTSLTVRRPIADTPLSLFISGRGSQMWGTTDSFGRAVGTVASAPNLPLVGAATVTRSNAPATLSIAELQAGVQFDVELRRVPANAFFRAALEYQHWTIDGLPTGGAGFGGTINNVTVNSFSSAGLGDTQLVGVSFGAGIMW
jgi:hypothetical protein